MDYTKCEKELEIKRKEYRLYIRTIIKEIKEKCDMDRHAYMIMCHNNFELLKKLLILLDDERNDIYLHVDKKANNFDSVSISSMVKHAQLMIIKRVQVNWGGYSLIKVELLLLEQAVKKNHSYYHLLSGVDLPLKTQDEIYKFFEDNAGNEFVAIDNSTETGGEFFDRIGQYHFLQDYIGRTSGYKSALLEFFESKLISVQKLLHINRKILIYKKIYKGSNWFSITHDFAIFLLSKKKEIKKNFGFGLCADELFLQTVIMESPFRNRIVNDCLRYIDWERGKPYIFSIEDYERLLSCGKLFARKFDYDTKPEIIEHIFNTL